MKEKRNGIISLWKFLFAIVIVFFHGNQFYDNTRNPFFYGGYIAVEFFFIVSGFYLAKKSLNEEYIKEKIPTETINYILKKIKSIFPYIFLAFIESIILKISISNQIKPNEIINSIWNLLLLREFGFRSILILPQLWYLSAMLICLFIMYPILKKYKEKFALLISPLIVIFGLGYLNYNWLGLDHAYQNWSIFTKTGIIRGFIEINIGAIIYVIHRNLSNIEYTKIGKIFLTILGESLLICVLVIINYIDSPKHYDYIMLLFISLAILILTSEKTYDYKILSNNFFYYLEKLSMPIFINHILMINIVDNIYPLSNLISINQSILSVLLSIIISAIELKVINLLKRKNISKKTLKIFIKNI